MPDSSASEDDARFRIPRGASDEEIDSDLASVSSEDGPAGMLLSDMIPARTAPVISGFMERLSRRAAREEVATYEGDLEDDGEDEDEEDGARDRVVFAATGRRDLDRAERKRAREVMPGVGEEGVCGAGGTDVGGGEMMERMMRALGEEKVGVKGLRKRLEKGEKKGKGPLKAPLPEVVTGRIERAAAYGQTKEEVTERWAGIVQKNRKAKQLVFPLNGPGRVLTRNTGSVAAGLKAMNPYEAEIHQLLKEGGVAEDEDVVNREEDELVGKVSVEELMKRRHELAKMRSLMFNYERKMKRIKKIKSRKYRKILKRDKARITGETIGSDSDEDPASIAIDAERRRAEERMTLRHKNTSKWIKRQLQRGEINRNPEARAAVEEQLRLHQELKRRQEGVVDLSGSERDSDGSDSDAWSDDDVEGRRRRTEQELSEMREELEQGEASDKSKKKRGVMAMRFMQAAQEKQRKEALALLTAMGDDDEGSHDESDGFSSEEAGAGAEAAATGSTGRQRFQGTGVKESRGDPTRQDTAIDDDGIDGEDEAEERKLERQLRREYEDAAESGVAAPTSGDVSLQKLAQSVQDGNDQRPGFTTALTGRLSAQAENPWLRPATREEPVVADVEVVTGSNAETEETLEGFTDKSIPAVLARAKKAPENAPTVLALSKKSGARHGESIPKRRVRFERQRPSDATAPHNNPDPADAVKRGKGKKRQRIDEAESGNAGSATRKVALAENREDAEAEADRARMEMVARAFAGAGGADLAEFKAGKDAEVESALPSALDIGAEVLPGWGSWGGAGSNKKRKKGNRPESAFARAARERLESARAAAQNARADKGLDHVILSTRRVKKAADLTLASVPFPFTSREQWEREVSAPVSRELLAGRAYKAAIEPGLVVKRGAAIEPIRHGAATNKGRKDKKDEKAIRNDKTRKGHDSTKRKVGRAGVIDFRKEVSKARNSARKGLMS